MTCPECGWYIEDPIMLGGWYRGSMADLYDGTPVFDGAPWDAYCSHCGAFLYDCISVIR